MRGKIDIQNIRKTLCQKIIDDKAQLSGPEIPLDQVYISLVPDGGQNSCIGAGPSDAVFFQLLDKGCLRKPWTRLSKVLFRFQAMAF